MVPLYVYGRVPPIRTNATMIQRRRRVVFTVCAFVLFLQFRSGVEPKPTPAKVVPTTSMEKDLGYIVVISSFERENEVIGRSLESIMSELDVPIHVWGYLPPRYESHPRIQRHERTITSVYHSALDSIPDEFLPRWVDDGTSHRDIKDDPTRTRWRSRIVLDAWVVLTEARSLYPTSHIIWIENDVTLKRGFARMLEFPDDDKFLSCYIPNRKRRDIYRGNGAVCLVFGPTYDLTLLLGYHMVEPLDWILLRGARSPVRAFGGAIHPRGHKTTRLRG